MTFLRNFPTYETAFYTLVWGEQFNRHTEVDFSCSYVSGDKVNVGGWEMSVDDALQFINFYQQHDTKEGPCGLSYEIQFTMTDPECLVPGHVASSVVMWLKHALGVERYDGSFDSNWEEY